MDIKKENLDQLKEKFKDGLYEGEISFSDETDNLQSVSFLYRKPTTADIEAHAKASQRNPLVANLNLVQSLIVYPESGPVIARLRDYPATTGRFVDEAISPFFGANVAVKSRKL